VNCDRLARKVRVWVAFVLLQVAGSLVALAAGLPADAALPRVIRGALLELLPQSPTEPLQTLPVPLCLPTGNLDTLLPPQALNVFERVPLSDGPAFEASELTLMAQLRRLDKTLELSDPQLSEDQERDLQAARALLYQAGTRNDPSEVYKIYLSYETKERELLEKIRRTPDAGARAVLTRDLRDLRNDWEVYGRRDIISNALISIQRFGSGDARSLKNSWDATLHAEEVGDYSQLWDFVSSMSDWTAVTIPVPASSLAGSGVSVANTQGGYNQALPLEGVIELSFRVGVFHIPRPALAHPFLRSPRWRSTDSYVLSDGIPKDSPAELVPRAVTSLIVVKGLEIRFDSPNHWRGLARLMQASASVRAGSFPISGHGMSSFSSPGYIALSNPCIVGAFVAQVPKIPNPLPTDRWPWW
jgi:hypothetical protein